MVSAESSHVLQQQAQAVGRLLHHLGVTELPGLMPLLASLHEAVLGVPSSIPTSRSPRLVASTTPGPLAGRAQDHTTAATATARLTAYFVALLVLTAIAKVARWPVAAVLRTVR
jgi:hypothetical protein